MPIPILVDQIFCRSFPQRSEPLWAVGSHPNEIARRDWVPVLSQAVNTAPGKHEEPMFHYMDLYHRQGCARLIGHRIHREIKRWIIGKQSANLQPIVSHHWLGLDAALLACQEIGSLHANQVAIRLLDHGCASGGPCPDYCFILGRVVGIAVWSESLAVNVQFALSN